MPVVRIDGFVFWLVNLCVIISSVSSVFTKTSALALAAAISVTRPSSHSLCNLSISASLMEISSTFFLISIIHAVGLVTSFSLTSKAMSHCNSVLSI